MISGGSHLVNLRILDWGNFRYYNGSVDGRLEEMSYKSYISSAYARKLYFILIYWYNNNSDFRARPKSKN